jgi:hypothetical protein
VKTKRRESYKLIDGTNNFTDIACTHIQRNLKKFKRKWKGKPKGNFKNKRACYRCGKTGHFKANCPKTNRGKKQK